MRERAPSIVAEDRAARRADRMVHRLLAGRRLRPGALDAGDVDAIRAAARMAGARESYPRLSATFRRRLTARLADSGSRPSVTRRTAMAATLSAAGGALLGAVVERVTTGPGAGSGRAVEISPGPAGARWVDVGVAFGQLREGVPVRVEAGGVMAFVVRRGERPLAVSAVCTHQACTLAWRGSEGALVCPCHGARFAPDGRSLPVPYRLPPLPRVRARVAQGRVEVLGT